MPVHVIAGDRHEQGARVHAPGVEGDAANVQRPHHAQSWRLASRRRATLRRTNDPQTAFGLEALDQFTQTARPLGLGRNEQIGERAGSDDAVGSVVGLFGGHAPLSMLS